MSARKGYKMKKTDRPRVTAQFILNATRGGVQWQYWWFRSRIIPALINDLMRMPGGFFGGNERNILITDPCPFVRAALAIFTIQTQRLLKHEAGFTMGQDMINDLEILRSFYVRWNDVTQQSIEASRTRKTLLDNMLLNRRKFVKDSNRNQRQFKIFNNVDQSVADNIYSPIAQLVIDFPNVFPKVEIALNRKKKNEDRWKRINIGE